MCLTVTPVGCIIQAFSRREPIACEKSSSDVTYILYQMEYQNEAVLQYSLSPIFLK